MFQNRSAMVQVNADYGEKMRPQSSKHEEFRLLEIYI